MNDIKSLFDGKNVYGLKLKTLFIDSLKYELHFEHNNFNILLQIPSKNERLIYAFSDLFTINVYYIDEVLNKISTTTMQHRDDFIMQTIDYKNRTVLHEHYKYYTKETLLDVTFEELNDSDYIFNLNVKDGSGTKVQKYINSIEEIYSTYGIQKYM